MFNKIIKNKMKINKSKKLNQNKKMIVIMNKIILKISIKS